MQNRLIIVHGWADKADRGWFLWLKEKMESREWKVVAPNLPNPKTPHKDEWLEALKSAAGDLDTNSYIVAHSLGCIASIKFILEFPETVQVGGAIFVAGAFRDPNEVREGEDEETRMRRKEWHGGIDFEKLRKQIPRSAAIFSDNDPWVTLDNVETYKRELASEIIIEHAKGHFSFIKDDVGEMLKIVEILEGWTK